MGAYCNLLHGFLLLCHGSTVGAGPTLHASIRASAKQVTNCSLSLLKEAVSSCGTHFSFEFLKCPKFLKILCIRFSFFLLSPPTADDKNWDDHLG